MKEVRNLASNADVVLDIGGMLTTELNTGMWTGNVDASNVVSIQDNFVLAGNLVFVNVAIEDVLAALCERVTTCCNDHGLKLEALSLVGATGDATSDAAFYPRLQWHLRCGDTVVSATGTCMIHLNKVLLPEVVTAEGQGLWGSIGWATPACL